MLDLNDVCVGLSLEELVATVCFVDDLLSVVNAGVLHILCWQDNDG